MNNLIEEIKSGKFGESRINESMKHHSTMAVGGNANLLVIPKDLDSLIAIIKRAEEENVEYFIRKLHHV